VKIIPLWTSHYSIGRSILTLDKPSETKENGPQSIIQICLDNKIKDLFLVENNMSGFVKALKNCQEYKINLNFGLKLTVCANISTKDTESLQTEYKVIIFISNDAGYQNLLKIYSTGATEGFYYRPRIDCATIKKYWSNDLKLMHPFYDSFLHRNLLFFANCAPNFDFVEKELFCIEKNDLPFNYLIEDFINRYTINPRTDTILTKSIYYKDKADFKAYLTDRAMHNRTTLNSPNLDFMNSDEFCFEALK
jgi:DNA polymerase III subunit alpha